MSAANIHNTQRSLEELKKYFRPLAKFIRISTREPMCPGAMPGGVRGARWTQIDAIARADVPWRHVEWRLPCQMNCRKAWNRALTAVRGRLGFFLQVIARADVTRSYARRGLQRSMDTNRCHRAIRCALQAPRKAIAVPDDLQESANTGSLVA